MSDAKTVAIIPARGGSKRIPRKNIKPFLGKPIIEYAITNALESGVFDKIIVSTDDQEIADVAINAGAEIPFFRSEKNADDYADTVSVLAEVLENLSNIGAYFDFGCCIYPTSPLLNKTHLINGLNILKSRCCDTVFPCVKYSYPIQRSLYHEDGKIKMIWPENYYSRSQDLKPVYHDAGQFYWFNTAYIKNKGKLFSENSYAIELNELEVQDIDTISDWELAEIKYKLLKL